MWTDLIKELLNRQGWRFNDPGLYEQALTHSSFAHEKNNTLGNNERLEFLGDAVLELIISDYLYRVYPHFPEGKLTRLRAGLVCRESLAHVAYHLNLGDYLRLGKGETAGGGSSRPSLLADAVEALIGALFLDVGFALCYKYAIELFRPVFQMLDEGVLRQDYKTLLQEYVQVRNGVTPSYRITGESGPDHQKTFAAQCLIKGNVVGTGTGRSKKEAEQDAAKEAWHKLT